MWTGLKIKKSSCEFFNKQIIYNPIHRANQYHDIRFKDAEIHKFGGNPII